MHDVISENPTTLPSSPSSVHSITKGNVNFLPRGKNFLDASNSCMWRALYEINTRDIESIRLQLHV